MKQNNLFELLKYLDKKNGKTFREIQQTNRTINVSSTRKRTNFHSSYHLRSYHQNKKQRSYFDIMLNESLEGNLNIIVYHLAINKINNEIDTYDGKIKEPTIRKMTNELREFFSSLLLDKGLVDEVMLSSKIGKTKSSFPVIYTEISLSEQKLNSFIIKWLAEEFESNREEINKYIDSFDIFKNKNLIKDYVKEPKSLAEFIKNEPDWQTLLELKYGA